MNLTKNLKEYALKNLGVDENSTDDQIKAAIGEALAKGELSADKFAELSKDEQAAQANQFESALQGLSEAVKEIRADLAAKKNQNSQGEGGSGQEGNQNQDPEKSASQEGNQGNQPDGGQQTKKKSTPSRLEKMLVQTTGYHPVDDSDSEDEKDLRVRVKEAAEQYDDTSKALVYPSVTEKGRPHAFSGRPVTQYKERDLSVVNEPSELGKAINGSVAKFLCATVQMKSKSLAFRHLPRHDKELLCYAMENLKWNGSSDGGHFADIKARKLTPDEQKALIDDSETGGIEAVPIVFDDAVIQTPLLHGELFPLVNSIPLDRGRRVEGVETGTVTGGWGGVDDSDIDLFDTTSYISAFDTTIFRWEGGIRIGLDFLSDSPIDFGAHVTAQYGERLLEDLDNVIATGTGLNQPEGVMNKSGTTSVAFSGSTSIGNYESLRFGVTKAEHRPNLLSTAVFCGTETSYQRMKAIPVDSSDDRRLFGQGRFGSEGQDDYSMMNRKYAINESLTNQQIFYAILGRYRMYRRRGLTMRSSTEGDFLIRRNEMLIIAMARYGGQLERGAVAAVTTDAES